MSQTPPTVNLHSLFFSLLEEDSPFGHGDQLLIALVVVCTKNERVADRLADEYSEFTTKKDRRLIKRLSPFFAFAETMARVGATAGFSRNRSELRVQLRAGKEQLPVALLTRQAEAIADALDVRLSVSISGGPRQLLSRVGVSR